MALQKQLVSINLTSGLDTKTDARLLQAPALTRLENGVFRNGSISKRWGSTAFGRTNAAGATISPSGLALHGDKLICEAAGQFYAWASGPQQWEPLKHPAHGYTPPVGILTKTQVARNGFTQKDFDGVYLNGYSVYAWVEERPSDPAGAYALCYSIVDESSGVELSRFSSGWTVGTLNPRVLALTSTKAAVLYFHDGLIGYVTIDTSAASPAFSAETTLVSGVDSSGRFDALMHNAGFAIVAWAASSSTITIGEFDTTLAQKATLTWTTNGSQGLTLTYCPSNGALFVFYFDATANDGKMRVASLNNVGATYAISNVGGPFSFGNSTPFDRATGAAYGLPGEMRGVIDYDGELRSITYDTGGCSTTDSTNGFAYLMRLVGRAFVLNGYLMVPAVNLSLGGSTSVERTGFLLTYEPDSVYNDHFHPSGFAARILPGLADIPDGNRLGSPLVLSSTKVGVLFNERGRSAYTSRAGTVTDLTPKGISRAEYALANLRDVPRTYLGKTLYIGGARPLACDGVNVFDAGFALFPEGLSGGSGTQAFAAVYRFVDAQGQTWRSAPSPSVLSPLGGLPTLTVTSKGGGGQVEIELYRTVANGTVFYKINSVNGPTANTKVNNSTNAIAGSNPSDTDLVVGEPLYTTGNILESIAPPAYSIACAHQQRLWISGLENPYEYRFSTPVVEGEAVRFNEALGGRVPASTGKIVALASLDDKAVIFTERAIYVVLGDGPDNAGNGDTYTTPQLLPADVGCTTWRSVVRMPDGIMFQSAKGICLLNRQLGVDYVGAAVEGFLNPTSSFSTFSVRSAVVVADQSQVRFQADNSGDTSRGIALVYDYLHKDESGVGQWAIFSLSPGSGDSYSSGGYGASDALMWKGTYVRLRSDGVLYQESAGSYLENGSAFPLLIETAWLKFSAVQGMQRIWRALLIGNNPASNTSTLNWSVGYDYSSTYAAADALTETVAGGSSPFQLRRHLRIQKCEALRFKIWDSGQSAAPYQGVEIDNITLEVGIRQGAYKLPSTKSA